MFAQYPEHMSELINAGVTPPDFATPVGQVRLLIGDTDVDPSGATATPEAAPQLGEYAYFSDDEIIGLLGLHGNSVKRTAARMLRTIAASQVLLLKKWSSADISVDASVVSKELRAAADALEAEAAGDDERDGSASAFLITPTGPHLERPPLGAEYRPDDFVRWSAI